MAVHPGFGEVPGMPVPLLMPIAPFLRADDGIGVHPVMMVQAESMLGQRGSGK